MAGSRLTASLTLGVKVNDSEAKRYLRTIRQVDREQSRIVGRSGARSKTALAGRAFSVDRRGVKQTTALQVEAQQTVMRTKFRNIAREEKARAAGIRRQERAQVRAAERVARVEEREQRRAREQVFRAYNRESRRRIRLAQREADAMQKATGFRQGGRARGRTGRFGLFDSRRTQGGHLFTGANAALVSQRSGEIARGGAELLRRPVEAVRDHGRAVAEINTLLDENTDITAKSASMATREAALRYGNDVQQQAQAYYDIISAGAGSQAEADALLAESNRLAIAGNASLSESADGLTSVMNAYGLSGDQASRATASMMAAVKSGKTTIPELAGSIGRVAPMSNALGVSMEELNAALATTTKQGISTSESASGMKALFANIKKPTREASREARRLGVEWNETALRAKGLDAFLRDVTSSAKFNEESWTKLVGSVEGGNTVVALTTDNMREFGKAMDAQAEGAETMDEAVRKMMDTDDRKLRKTTAAFKEMEIALGEGLIPLITDGAEALKPLVDDFSKWSKENPEQVKQVGKLAIGVIALAGGVKVGADAVMVFNGAMAISKTLWPVFRTGAVKGAEGMRWLARDTKVGRTAVAGLNTEMGNIKTTSGKAAAGVSLLAAAAIGFEVGTIIDDTLGWSDALAQVAANATFARDELVSLEQVRNARTLKEMTDQRRKLREETQAQDRAEAAAFGLTGVGGIALSAFDEFSGRQAERNQATAELDARIREETDAQSLLKEYGIDPKNRKQVESFARARRQRALEARGLTTGPSATGGAGESVAAPTAAKVEGDVGLRVDVKVSQDGPATATVRQTRDTTGMFQNRGTTTS